MLPNMKVDPKASEICIP